MTAPTLTSIGAAIFAALGALRRPAAPAAVTTLRPFSEVEWFAGQDLLSAERATLGRGTAAFLAWPGGRAAGANGEMVSTFFDDAEVVMRALWVVYVQVSDPRDDAAMYTGAPNEPGMLDAVERVVAKVTSLRIAGLWGGAPRVELVDVRVGRIVPRATAIYVVTFATHHTVMSVDPLPDAVPLERIDGPTGPEGAPDLVEVHADTTAT